MPFAVVRVDNQDAAVYVRGDQWIGKNEVAINCIVGRVGQKWLDELEPAPPAMFDLVVMAALE